MATQRFSETRSTPQSKLGLRSQRPETAGSRKHNNDPPKALIEAYK